MPPSISKLINQRGEEITIAAFVTIGNVKSETEEDLTKKDDFNGHNNYTSNPQQLGNKLIAKVEPELMERLLQPSKELFLKF